jgi:UDP:flavonoid glycosyltransferase YjiC (YdhE family)
VAVTPLSLLSNDTPPIGSPFRPASGPVSRGRDAALRSLMAVVQRRMIDPRLDQIRASAGLGPVAVRGRLFDSLYSPYLVLAQGVPGLEYPRGDLPAQVHYVGRLAGAGPVASSPLPDWWGDLSAAEAVVHVTQGTLDTDLDDLLKPALAGLAEDRVLVVCTTGGASPSVLGELPANARVAQFLPHDELLPLVDVMVTNGGWGGVLAAVQAGVPLVVAGASLDKPEVARRVAWSGAGVNLRTGKPGAAKVRDGVREVLGRPEMRSRAKSLGAALIAAGGVSRGADLVEGLL